MSIDSEQLESAIRGKIGLHSQIEGVVGIDPMIVSLLAQLAMASARAILSWCSRRVSEAEVLRGLRDGDRITARNYKLAVQNLLWRCPEYQRVRELSFADRVDTILCDSVVSLAMEEDAGTVQSACRELLLDDADELDFNIM